MKYILVILSLFLFSVRGTAASHPKLEKGPVLSGQVSDTEGNPIAQVYVTDGFTWARTDAEGRYRLVSPCPERVRFVSVRIPSTYSPVIDKGVPVFYTEVPSWRGRERKADIKLVRDEKKGDKFSMMMIADPQAHVYDPGAHQDNTAYCATDVWKDIFEDMRKRAESEPGQYYGLCLGDISAWGPSAKSAFPSVYPLYRDLMGTLGFPFFNVIGNHDHLPGGEEVETDDDSVFAYESFFGPRNYSFDLGQIHCVVVDNCMFIKGLRRYPFLYGLEDEFLEWLKGDLALVPKDMPVMVFMHANPFGDKGPNSWVYDDMQTAYKLDELLEALQGFEKLYVWSGHTHTGHFVGRVDSPANPSGIEQFVIARCVGPDNHTNEHISGDGTPRGYVVMEVSGKDISWKYHIQQVEKAPFKGKAQPELKWKLAKTDESVQLRAYPRGAYGDDFVYANVFLWDKSWNLPVLRIGDRVYPMKKGDCYDLAYKEMIQSYKNQKVEQSWAGKRFHTFYVRVPEDASGMGTVEVTDRFGRTWTTDVSVDPVRDDEGHLRLVFDFRSQPEGCPGSKAYDISFTAASGDATYAFTLSSGRYLGPNPAREGHIAIADKNSYLTLPAVEGYRLVQVSVHPDGLNGQYLAASICNPSGSIVPGGEKLVFFGNATDSWYLTGTKPNTSYRIVSLTGAFRIGELRLTYEKE